GGAGGARRRAVALAGEGVGRLVLAEAAEDVHLIRRVDRRRGDRTRVELEGDRQRADVERRRRRAVVAGREVAVDRGSAWRARQAVVWAPVAGVRRRPADRARLDERAARAAGAVGAGDAALAVVRPARAGAGLARACAAVAVGAARCAAVRASARVVGAGAAARAGAGPGAARTATAPRARRRTADATSGQEVAGEEYPRAERQIVLGHRPRGTVARARTLDRDRVADAGAGGRAVV